MKKEIVIINYKGNKTKIGLKEDMESMYEEILESWDLDAESIDSELDLKVFSFNISKEVNAFTVIDTMDGDKVCNIFVPLDEANTKKLINASKFPYFYSEDHLFELVKLVGGKVELPEEYLPLCW